MSSPFASLNKYRKVPISKNPTVPTSDPTDDERYKFHCSFKVLLTIACI